MKTGRVLGIDLGIKRTGLAVSDGVGITSRGLDTITPKSRAEDVAFLVGLCAAEDVSDVVIGLPLMPDSGDLSPMAKRATGFAQALATALATTSTTVHLVDERGTSKLAASRLVASDVKKSDRRALLDSESARILIELFLDSGPTTTLSATTTTTTTTTLTNTAT